MKLRKVCRRFFPLFDLYLPICVRNHIHVCSLAVSDMEFRGSCRSCTKPNKVSEVLSISFNGFYIELYSPSAWQWYFGYLSFTRVYGRIKNKKGLCWLIYLHKFSLSLNADIPFNNKTQNTQNPPKTPPFSKPFKYKQPGNFINRYSYLYYKKFMRKSYLGISYSLVGLAEGT